METDHNVFLTKKPVEIYRQNLKLLLMYTKNQILLHERSVAILEMIKAANSRIESARHNLYLYDHAGTWHIIRLMNDRKDLVKSIEKFQGIRNRLVMWYADIMERLFNEAMTRVSKHTTAVSC